MHSARVTPVSRAEAALGAEGKAEVNALIIKVAQEFGCCGGARFSSADTTVQEPLIGYPNEPGILKGLRRTNRTSDGRSSRCAA